MKRNTLNTCQHYLAQAIISIALFLGIFTSCQDEDFGFTAEEISYETKFFKEFGHPDPDHNWGFKTLPVADYTDSAQTRSVNPNSNEWSSKYGLNVPSAITEEEAEYVYNYYNSDNLPPSQAIHWSDFFIQYVNSYNEFNDCAERNMDYLGYESMSGEWEHVNNFNTTTHATQYVYNAGTENWTYRSSKDDTYHNNLYNIQYLSFNIGSNHYEGWYIGFDYTAKTSAGSNRTYVKADGKYCDWIVKVTPGIQRESYTQRVMCEDLGNSFDWDFNDVVFDVSFQTEETWWPRYKKSTYAKITLQAAGGELPIIVGTTDENYEVHRLLGNGTLTPLIRPNKVAIYTIEIDKESGLWSWIGNLISNDEYDASMIPIYVNRTNTNNLAQQLQGRAVPQKFACPTSVDWSPELTNIAVTYPRFTQWVQDADAEGIWDYNPNQQQNVVIEQ